MQPALHIIAKVLPGNRLEVQLPSGTEGQEVSVFVVLPNQTHEKKIETQTRFFDLTEMAADSDIQRELAAINSEFAIAEMDGLR